MEKTKDWNKTKSLLRGVLINNNYNNNPVS